MFGVLDGHGGSTCAEYVSDRLPYAVNEHLLSSSSIEEALFKAFIDTDNEFLTTQSDTSGATACVVLYDGRHTLYTANTGDCRAIVCRNRKAVELSRDMKASSAEEIARIAAMGVSDLLFFVVRCRVRIAHSCSFMDMAGLRDDWSSECDVGSGARVW
jgi:protein phosphatase 2C family protein 2/3